LQLCYPEAFERIEQCKLCKKCNATRVSNVLKTPAEQLLFERYKNGFMLILFLMK
jgi:hypothetical protein